MKNLPVARVLLLTGSLALAGTALAAAAPSARPSCDATRAECPQPDLQRKREDEAAKRREEEFLRNKSEALRSMKGIEQPGPVDADDLGLKDADSPGYTLKEAPLAASKPALASKPGSKVVQRRLKHNATSGIKRKTHSQQER